MNKRLALITGLGLGAGAMFLLDPDRGRRRRALLRDKAVHLTRTTGLTAGKISRDLRNRAIGVASGVRGVFREVDVTDSVLADRIRSRLGRYPVHRRSINIDSQDGVVRLSGDVLSSELDTILSAVSRVRGVKKVVNNLTVHETAEGISSLQGYPVGANA